ncbi:hypothetical protein K5B08_01360, partial [Candidatus Carsonella ruddii]|nr:hypothetical protein [Candidatus Carsonella ruddii]
IKKYLKQKIIFGDYTVGKTTNWDDRELFKIYITSYFAGQKKKKIYIYIYIYIYKSSNCTSHIQR